MEMETLISQLSGLLNNTLSPDQVLVSSAAAGLDHLSHLPQFPFSLLTISTGGDNQGLRIAAATYLKNFTRRHMEGDRSVYHIEFRNQLAQALLQVEPAILKVLVEAFRLIIVNDFVKENSWPDFVSQLKSVIQNSNLISTSAFPQWNTINALTVLQTIVKPFQYFLNPKVPKEPVPSQLELIAQDILVPLQTTFHHFVDKALSYQDEPEIDTEQALLLLCKCIYFSVRSYMPSALRPLLPLFCVDLFRILDSLSLTGASHTKGYLLRLKTAKRCLIIFCALTTRHRKHADKLMPNITSNAIRIAKISPNISMLDSLSERIISLAFDVISHVLETGPGWRIVSPHFSSLLDSAILPALSLNQKDMSDWEEDSEEYIRKNLPSELDEISGWAEDLFTARKSAINLLGVIAISKGPPVGSAVSKRKKGEKSKRKERQSSVGELLVVPFLSKFPIPSVGKEPSTLQDYYGVLMAYGGLQDFLNERNPDYTSTLVRNRILPLYSLCPCSPYLIATSNWVLGELASCLPQVVSADIYSSLTKALVMPDGEFSCYPVRASAAGAIAKLLENDYVPHDWLSLLQILVNRIGNVDDQDENECSLLFQLLGTLVEVGQKQVAVHIPAIVSSIASVISKSMPHIPEPWPQVVEHGFAALASITPIWEDFTQDDVEMQKDTDCMASCASIARTFSRLLQQAWLVSLDQMEETGSNTLPPSSCLDDTSCLLGFIMRSISTVDEVIKLKVFELLTVWSSMIADWHTWEETEDLAVFSSIQEAVNLHKQFDCMDLFKRKMSSQNPSAGPSHSIIEDISTFVSAGISAYPSATRRACSCVHTLLHGPRFSVETETIRQSIAVEFAVTAFSYFRDTREEHNKSSTLWKPLLLAVSSCYILYPEKIEEVLDREEDRGFTVWAHAMADVSTIFSDPGVLSESEIKLTGMALAKVVEQLLRLSTENSEILHKCFLSLIEACIHLKEVQDEENNGASDEEIDDDNDDDGGEEDSDYDEDSEDDELEETEEEFLDRYAKAATELDDNIVEEGDLEDEAHEVYLGALDEMDMQEIILPLISSHQGILIKGQAFPPDLVERIMNSFPQWSLFFRDTYN